ncbi:hypothetical protein JKA74_16390 [Marivirga sp. S37H4]|uniref:histidine kinase n=1 Tax=Marivirga aurantiaca TaxID=2802615 RepID=A0A934X1J8_9BACT|nr:ATP-binding protein [Marivirga aurantiaca]MBK6266626.1 hypothetical protein [Marivirga aurantiaca]
METHTLLKDEIKSLLETAFDVSSRDIVQAVSLAERALFKSQKIKEKSDIHANGLNLLSFLQRRNKEYNTSKSLADRAFILSKKISYDKGNADAQLNIAKALLHQQKQSEAIPYLLDATLLYKKISEFNKQGLTLCLIGNIYEEFKDFKNALTTYNDALEISKNTNDKFLEAEAYLCLGDLHQKIERTIKASGYIEKSIQLKKEFENKKRLARAYFISGKIHLKNNNFQKAESDFTLSLELYTSEDNPAGIVQSYEQLGSIYVAKNEAERAIDILTIAIEKAEEHQLIKSLYKCHHLLYVVYKDSDKTKSLYHLEKYVEIKESFDKKYIQNMIDSYQVLTKIEDNEKDAEKEIELASIIEKKNTEMDSFFYRVSHDLKGPIASLLGLSDLAKRDITDKKALQYFRMYENQIKRLNMIVMELINITELNYREIKRTVINFYEIIDNCITAYTYLPNFDKIHFKIEVQSNLSFSSEWYIVNTILQNLIENSVKYIDKEKKKCTIHISVDSKKKDIVIKVIDNGQGIAQEHQQKIFDMFYRANNSAEGTGLGLFILKRAVERLKGDIKLDSTLGEGTTFTIILPSHSQ